MQTIGHQRRKILIVTRMDQDGYFIPIGAAYRRDLEDNIIEDHKRDNEGNSYWRAEFSSQWVDLWE